MPYENPQESIREAVFLTRPEERFKVSEEMLGLYNHVCYLAQTDEKPTDLIEKAKVKLHDKFIADNEGVEMPVDELLKNLDRYNSPL